MKIEIITIGDELLAGGAREDNGAWLSKVLTGSALSPTRITIIPDDGPVIAEQFRKAAARSDFVIATGGLGPTVDDRTRRSAIEAAGGATQRCDWIVDQIRSRFEQLGLEMPAGYEDLAVIPAGAGVLPNPIGAAVGLSLEIEGCRFFLLPGVPAEMRSMFNSSVMPVLAGGGGKGRMAVCIFGVMETSVEDGLKRVLSSEEMKGVSIIAGPTGTTVYLPEGLDRGGIEDELAKVFGGRIFSFEGKSMEEVALALLTGSGKTMSTAESLTGGTLASTIISVAGASAAFLEGFITYSDKSKGNRLGVDKALIAKFGAVSGEVCAAMAAGAREMSGADLALSTTGIAGPGGATVEKPVGLAYVGLAAEGAIYCRKIRSYGDRANNITRTVYNALDMLRLYLEGRLENLEPFTGEGG